MKRGIKTFSRAIRDGNPEKAEDALDSVVQGSWGNDEWEGYRRALEGAIEVFSSNNELALPLKISEEEFSNGKAEEFRMELEEKASQDFRPGQEIGFNSAWADILAAISET